MVELIEAADACLWLGLAVIVLWNERKWNLKFDDLHEDLK
jgi:hypothetical protein